MRDEPDLASVAATRHGVRTVSGPARRRPEVAELRERLAAAQADGAAWRELVETLPQIVWIARPDGRHVHFNRQWMEFTGLTMQESVGFGWNQPFHPDDRGRAAALWSQATSTGEPYEIECRLRRHDGIYRWMLGRAMPLHDADGRIVKWFGTCTDIEEQKRAQAEFEESRSLHRLAGSMARLGGWSLDLTDQRITWSEEIYKIFGHPTDPAPDLEASIMLYLPEHRASVRAAIDRCSRLGEPFDLEAQVQTHDGRQLWLRVIGEAGVGPDGTVTRVRGAVQDISAAEEANRRNEALAARLAATFEGISDGLYILDQQWRFTYLNSQAERLLRRPREELLGREIWEPFAATIGTEFETTLRRGMAEQTTVLLEEYHYPPLDSWFQVVAYPSEQGLTVYLRDVSEQHRARQELRRMNDELTEANLRLADAAQLKDDLLSMASHELRTPLTPILGFLEIVQSRTSLTMEQQQMLKVVGANARRMLRLVDDLLVVNRASAGVLVSQPQEVVVADVLAGMLEELGEVVGPVDLAVEGCLAVVDPQHLVQIVMNLLTNASKYGTPPVTVTAAPASHGRITIEVADRGTGVPPEFQDQMWDRFAQKDRGDQRTASGAGLGLSIVKLLAEANNGTVSYRDGTPTGAVFTVELPGSCEQAQLPASRGTDGGAASMRDHGGTRAPRTDDGGSVSPRPAGPQPHDRGSSTTATLPATPRDGAAMGDQVDPEEVVAWATRQLLHVESRDEAAGVVLRVIQRLGGWTTPAKLADVHALPLDVSFGLSEPILPVAPPHSIERMHLERHLPVIVEDARRAIEMVGSISRLRHAASVDPLTGLANRRGIDRLLARSVSGAAVVMLDLDSFKQVNDQHGHAAGDRILQDFGSCLRDVLRAGDHAARLGGDEFIAILAHTDEAGAARFVARLRQAWHAVREHPVGFSAGITEVGADESATDALSRADIAMYSEKAVHHSDGGQG